MLTHWHEVNRILIIFRYQLTPLKFIHSGIAQCPWPLPIFIIAADGPTTHNMVVIKRARGGCSSAAPNIGAYYYIASPGTAMQPCQIVGLQVDTCSKDDATLV